MSRTEKQNPVADGNKTNEQAKEPTYTIEGLSRGTNLSVTQKEDRVISLMEDLADTISLIDEKKEQLKLSGRVGTRELNAKLSVIQKAKIRNEIAVLTRIKKDLSSQVKTLSKGLKSFYKKSRQKTTRFNLKFAAKKENYHNKNHPAIEKAITAMVGAMEKDDVKTLNAELVKLNGSNGDVLIMKALLKAPKFLHTKVVANDEARKQYLQHFRNEIKKAKK